MNKGKKGEQLFQQIMQQKGYEVQDVSDNPDYWNQDIDFVITSPTTGLTKTFEVKYDYRLNKTGNLYLETMNVNSKGSKGWFSFCKADYVAYGDATTNTFYIIPLQELKKKVQQLPTRWAKCGQDSEGLLISLKDIQDIIQIL